MISWVVVLDARVMGFVDGNIYQWLLGSCVEFSQTVKQSNTKHSIHESTSEAWVTYGEVWLTIMGGLH